jgi:excisionase family DNA binding protein
MIGTAPLVLDSKEAASLLKISVRTCRSWCAEGYIPAKKIGRSYLISTRTLLEHLAGQPPSSGSTQQEGR